MHQLFTGLTKSTPESRPLDQVVICGGRDDSAAVLLIVSDRVGMEEVSLQEVFYKQQNRPMPTFMEAA